MFPVLLLVAAALAYYYMQKKTIGAKRLKLNHEYPDVDTSLYLSEDVLTAYSPSMEGIDRPTRGVLTACSVKSYEFIACKPNPLVINNRCAVRSHVECAEKSVFTAQVPHYNEPESPLSEVTAIGDSFGEEHFEITTAKDLEDVVTVMHIPPEETQNELRGLVPPDPATAAAQKMAKKRKRNKKSKAQKSQQSEKSSMENVAVDNFSSVISVQEAAMELDRAEGTTT